MLHFLQEERARRDAESAELRTVLSRLLESGPGKYVNASQVRRILVLCGYKGSVADISVAISELFPEAGYVRRASGDNKHVRAYEGVGIKKGFSVAKVATVLESRHKEAGLIAYWEKELADEGMPADIRDVPDPSDPRRQPGPVMSYGIRVPTFNGSHVNASGSARHSLGDPFGAELAGSRYAFLSRAFEIPGFFESKHDSPYFKDPRDREQAWRLYCQGETPSIIARLLGREAGAIKRVLQRLEVRLRGHLRHAPSFEDKPDGKLSKPVRHLYANRWTSFTERRAWELYVMQRARAGQIARELEITTDEVKRILLKHKSRARMQVDRQS
jgi:hypothetical protein